jgi:hypothetical protein
MTVPWRCRCRRRSSRAPFVLFVLPAQGAAARRVQRRPPMASAAPLALSRAAPPRLAPPHSVHAPLCVHRAHCVCVCVCARTCPCAVPPTQSRAAPPPRRCTARLTSAPPRAVSRAARSALRSSPRPAHAPAAVRELRVLWRCPWRRRCSCCPPQRPRRVHARCATVDACPPALRHCGVAAVPAPAPRALRVRVAVCVRVSACPAATAVLHRLPCTARLVSRRPALARAARPALQLSRPVLHRTAPHRPSLRRPPVHRRRVGACPGPGPSPGPSPGPGPGPALGFATPATARESDGHRTVTRAARAVFKI